MSHELEIVDNKAQMFSGEGITPWHGLGNVIEGLATAEDALKLAGLDWTVRLEQVMTASGPYKDRFATVRETDNKHLGLVSNEYHVYQNAEAFKFLNNLTDTDNSDAVFSTAGSLFGGSRTFMTLKIGDRFMVGDNDAHDLYLMATNSHDGNQSFTVSVTPIRAVCNNTVTLGLAAAKTKWAMKHKKSLEGQVQNARELLEMSFRYEDAFQKAVDDLMAIEITKDKFYGIVDKIVPAPAHTTIVDEIMNVWEHEETVNMGGGEGNAWGAFNAITYYTDHKAYRTPESKFKSIIGTGTGQGFAESLRPKAQKALLALAK